MRLLIFVLFIPIVLTGQTEDSLKIIDSGFEIMNWDSVFDLNTDIEYDPEGVTGYFGLGNAYERDTTLTKTEIKGDTIFLYYKIYESCSAAVWPPCPGHTLKYREVYLTEHIRRDTAKTVEVEKIVKEKVVKY